MMDVTRDEQFMRRCLALAEHALGETAPNPMVGAVVVDGQGNVVGEGYHQTAGTPHAEVHALNQAGENAVGGTLYVNLEPCNHTGRTPPCTEAILASGIKRVVYGVCDPQAHVTGGVARLQAAGVVVDGPVLLADCTQFNEAFFHQAKGLGRPFIALKLAMSLNGKIAARSGRSSGGDASGKMEWLTGVPAREKVQQLRKRYDAVLTTAQTVLADDPLLTVRTEPPPVRMRHRVILDRTAKLDPASHRIFQTASAQAPVWWVVSPHYVQKMPEVSSLIGVRLLSAPENGLGFELPALFALLAVQGLQSILIEAGGQLAGELLQQRLVDRLNLFVAPKILSDPQAVDVFSAGVQSSVLEGVSVQIDSLALLGVDWLYSARLV